MSEDTSLPAGEPASTRPSTPAEGAASPGPLWARLREWVWRERELARALAQPGEPRRRRWLASAERSLAAGDETLAAWPLGRAGEGDPVAALGLYTQAAYLASLAADGAPADLAALADRAMAPLAAEALSPAAWALAAEAPRDEQLRLSSAARAACLGWLDRARGRCPTERLRRERRLRACLLALGVLLPALALALALRPSNLAARAAWKASSAHRGYATQGTMGATRHGSLLFHTEEEASPSVELDLGAERTVHDVEVINRSDCCAERSIPLVIEVSLDQKTWAEVARNDDGFSLWKARFPPRKARHVRLRVDRRSMLHLEDVRIH